MMSLGDSEDEMRNRADWMVPSDDVILELLDEYGNLTPRAVEDFGGPVSGHASDRLPVLARYGLVRKLTRGLYQITTNGVDYLNGDLNARDLEESEVTPLVDEIEES